METAGKLKFGISCNGYTFARWQANAITALLDNPHFELSLLIINDNPATKKSFVQKLFDPALLFRQYENYFLKIPAKTPVDISDKLSNCPFIKIKTYKKGKHSQYFYDEDVTIIKSHHLDFIVRFGFGIIRGEILNAAKHGVWSFHHGDEEKYRGGPPAFWEIFYNEHTTAVVLQRLTNTLDGGFVLKKGYFKTVNHSYAENFDTVLTHSSGWIKQTGLQLLQGNLEIEKLRAPTRKGKLYKAPGNFTFVVFLIEQFCNKLRFHLRDIFLLEIWNVARLENNLHEIFNRQPLKVKWMPRQGFPNHTYIADPFVITKSDNRTYLFEDFDYKTLKGRIWLYTENPKTGEGTYKHALFKLNTHLSYPSVFNYNNKIYCIPESYEGNKVELYEVREDLTFERKCTLLAGFPAVDATMLQHNGYFWLFCTRKDALPNAQLYIYYSQTVEGPYLPHLLNPVKTDIQSARPAGNFFYYNNKLIRPSQNCAVTYGGSLQLNHVKKLSPAEFEEETILTLSPFDKEYNKGLHTFSTDDGVVVIDGKKYIFSGWLAWSRLLKKFRR